MEHNKFYIILGSRDNGRISAQCEYIIKRGYEKMRKEQEQNQILKKELERSARLTGKDVFVDAYKIITEQEKEIERLKEEKKQAQIDVLNKVKDLMDKYYVFEGVCGYFIDDFKELIKEVENE